MKKQVLAVLAVVVALLAGWLLLTAASKPSGKSPAGSVKPSAMNQVNPPAKGTTSGTTSTSVNIADKSVKTSVKVK